MENPGQAPETNGESLSLLGIGVSPGIVIAPVLVIDQHCLGEARSDLSEEQVPLELARFERAVIKAEQELLRLRDRCGEGLEDAVAIIDAHLLMLRDRMLFDRSLELIRRERANAEWCLSRSLAMIKESLDRIDDPYLRERCNDVRHVAERIFAALGARSVKPFAERGERVIIAAHDLSPEDVIGANTKRIAGLLTEKGGITSHTAIVARSLGIPSVAAVERVIGQVSSGDLIILDGNSGRVILNPTAGTLAQYQEYQRQNEAFDEATALYVHLVSETLDGMEIRVSANIETVAELSDVLRYGSAGIGLFRSEFNYFRDGDLPDEEQLYRTYRDLLATLAPMPVTIRTLDIGGDKFGDRIQLGGRPIGPEKNPALGMRSIRFSLRQPEIFITQIRALLRAAVHGNLRILLPMISSLEELRKARAYIVGAEKALRREGLSMGAYQLGVLIEVPSSVFIADVLAGEVDFLSIGTNDLIQYSLAIDRDNQYVAHLYEPLHPAVLRMIRQTVRAAHDGGIEVGVCGEMAGDVVYVPVLLGLGIDELSMRPSAIPHAKRLIRHSTWPGIRRIGGELLHCGGSGEVRARLGSLLPELYPQDFLA